MDQFDIYVNVERPSGNHGKRKSFAKCSESIYANEYNIHNLEPNRTGPTLSGALDEKKSFYRAAALSLGLLCLLLLTGLITLVSSDQEMEMVLLQTSYNNLSKERDQLETSYDNLTKERNELQTNNSNLARERDQLQKGFEDLTKKKNELQRKLQGWAYFRGSFYYVSSSKKSWQESRDDCLQKHADLVINSKEEQEFTRSFQKPLWIGLTDRAMESTWKWVDGTLLTTSYWATSEPNGVPGIDEDCAEIKSYDWEKSWNDELCDIKKLWICEKTAN